MRIAARPLPALRRRGQTGQVNARQQQVYVAPANYLVLYEPGCGCRNFLLTDGGITRYYGVKGL